MTREVRNMNKIFTREKKFMWEMLTIKVAQYIEEGNETL
jgi:hypothetical protein